MCRRTARVGAAAAAALVCSLLTATPALAFEFFVEVNPSTAEAGGLVGIRASCEDTTTEAEVRSDAFGTVTVVPRNGFLVATAEVRADASPGRHTVILTCANGRTAESTLDVVAVVRPSRGPATGFGGTAGGGTGGILVIAGMAAILASMGLGAYALRRRWAGR